MGSRSKSSYSSGFAATSALRRAEPDDAALVVALRPERPEGRADVGALVLLRRPAVEHGPHRRAVAAREHGQPLVAERIPSTCPVTFEQPMASAVGITSGRISLLMNRKRSPSPRVRRRLQAVLGVTDFDGLFTLEAA